MKTPEQINEMRRKLIMKDVKYGTLMRAIERLIGPEGYTPWLSAQTLLAECRKERYYSFDDMDYFLEWFREDERFDWESDRKGPQTKYRWKRKN